jgi:beta-phosphoglucomutase
MRSGKAVIFDMDGVLVLSGPAHWVAWQEIAAAHGVALTRADFLGFNGFTNDDIVRRLWGEAATAAFSAQIADSKEKAYRAAVAAAVPLAPGCRELLATLAGRGYRVAVGSSAPAENVDLVLDSGGIRAAFAAVVHAGMVARGKPAPDIFLRAAELMQLPPSRCVVIEDAPSGISAALAAGMPAVGVLTNHTAGELLDAGARTVVDALVDVRTESIDALLP